MFCCHLFKCNRYRLLMTSRWFPNDISHNIHITTVTTIELDFHALIKCPSLICIILILKWCTKDWESLVLTDFVVLFSLKYIRKVKFSVCMHVWTSVQNAAFLTICSLPRCLYSLTGIMDGFHIIIIIFCTASTRAWT